MHSPSFLQFLKILEHYSAFLQNIASLSFPLTCYLWFLKLLLAICGNRVWLLVLPTIQISIPSRVYGWLSHWLCTLGQITMKLIWAKQNNTECAKQKWWVFFPCQVHLSSLFSSASEVMEEDTEWMRSILLLSQWDFGDVCYCSVVSPGLNKIVSSSI